MSDANVGEGVLEVTADTKPAESAITALGKHVNKQSDELVKFGQKGLFATGLLIGGLGAAGKAASDLNESTNAVAVTFGKNAEGILALGEKAATAMGLSNSAFNGLAVQFSAFADTIAGKGGDVVGTIQQITQRAADFASVMNIDVDEAARLFQSGLAGETEPLRKFGIDLSAAAVQAHALEAGITDGKSAMTEAQKVQSRYSLLMQATAKDAGDFANTSDGAANSQRILSAQMADMGAKIGTAVLPPLTAVIGGLSKAVGWISDLNDATGGMVGKLAIAGTGLLGAASAISLITGKVGQLREKFTSLGEDGARSMSGLGKALGAAAIVAGAAILVYGALADEKARIRDITNQFADALKAETEGQEGATRAAIVAQLQSSGLLKLGRDLGFSVKDMADIIEGKSVPAWDKLNATYDAVMAKSEGNELKVRDLGAAYDGNGYHVTDFRAKINELGGAMGTAVDDAKELAAANAQLGEDVRDAVPYIARRVEVEQKAVDVAAGYARARRETAYWEEVYARDQATAAEAEQKRIDAQQIGKAGLEEYARDEERATDAIRRHIEAMNDQIDTMRSAADANYGLRAATDDFTDFLQGLDKAVKDAKGDQEELNRIYRDGTKSAADVADATARVYEETLKASGQTITATQKIDAWNHSMLASAGTASGPLRQSIVDYLVQVNGIPADKATEIQMYVDAGLMGDAQRVIDETSAARTVAISADVDTASLAKVDTLLDNITRTRFVKINGQFQAINAFAGGTDYAPGGVALTGEEGPELIELPRGAKVHTAADTRTMLAERASWTAQAPEPGGFPEELTLIVEGQPLTARVVQHSRTAAATFAAGRRPG